MLSIPRFGATLQGSVKSPGNGTTTLTLNLDAKDQLPCISFQQNKVEITASEDSFSATVRGTSPRYQGQKVVGHEPESMNVNLHPNGKALAQVIKKATGSGLTPTIKRKLTDALAFVTKPDPLTFEQRQSFRRDLRQSLLEGQLTAGIYDSQPELKARLQREGVGPERKSTLTY